MLTRWLAISDAFVVLLVMAIAQFARFGGSSVPLVSGASDTPYLAVTIAIGVLWWLALGVTHSREPRILGHGPQEFQRVINSTWTTFAVVAVIGFLTQWQISRGYLLIAAPLGTLALLAYRGAWRLWVHARRDAGELAARVVVVGPSATVHLVSQRLLGAARAGFKLAAVAVHAGATASQALDSLGVPDLGELTDPVAQARSVGAEFIIIAGSGAMSVRESRQLGWTLEGTEIGLIVAPSLMDVAGPRISMSPVAGLPLMHVDAPTFAGSRYWTKTVTDRVGAVFLLLLAGVPMLVIAGLVRLTSRGPVLFHQQRVGLGMETFTMFKFRSMYADAEQRLEELRAANEGNGVHFKMRDDPRVTPLGKFLRRFSIDELPQLLNVFRGDMSLVGPRPPLPREMESWGDGVARRQLVKPGMTGLWQVSGRSDLSWEEAVRLDLYYAENWSMTGDLVILMRTVLAVLRPTGAY